jgi:hypothetical protein
LAPAFVRRVLYVERVDVSAGSTLNMAKSAAHGVFRVEDRVTNVERPQDLGTITAILLDDPAGAIYAIDLDRSGASLVAERVLVRADPRRCSAQPRRGS